MMMGNANPQGSTRRGGWGEGRVEKGETLYKKKSKIPSKCTFLTAQIFIR